MIDALISGKVYGQPTERTSKAGKPLAVAKVRAAGGDGESLFVNVIAFDAAPCTALLALEDGDSVALAGTLTPKVWTDLIAEHDENEMRKAFTVTERVAIAEAVAERLQGRAGNPDLKPNCGNISTIEAGQKTRDLAAAKSGLGSGKTLEAAQSVVAKGAPALVEAMDDGVPLDW